MRIFLSVIFLLICSCATEKPKDCWAPIRAAVKFRESGQYQKAIESIEEYKKCEIKPKEEPGMVYYYHLGWTYFEMGDYKKSIESYTKGIPRQPDYYFAYWRRGLSYEKIGSMTEAEADYKTAFELLVKRFPTNYMEVLDKNPDVKEKLLKK